jgi:glycosyltransferase involved in cell wall biosynthesis
LLRAAVRTFRKKGITFPDVSDADAFCRFVMTPNARACGADISPFTRHVLDSRPDVAAAYPGANHDAEDPGFSHWLENCAHECESEELHTRFKSALVHINPFDRIARIYRDRADLQRVYPDAFRTADGLEAFVGWLRKYGVFETSLEPEDVELFLRGGRTGFEDVLDYFFLRPELHGLFPLAFLPCGNDFAEWLTRYATAEGELTLTEIRWFQRRVLELDPSLLALLTALRNDWVRLRFPLAMTRFGWPEYCTWLRAQAAGRGYALPVLSAEPPHRVPILLQLETLHTMGTYAQRYPRAFKSKEALREFAEEASATATPLGPFRSSERVELESAIRGYGVRRGVNVAGYFQYAAGVGTSVRALTHALDAAAIPFHEVTLPVGPSAMSSSGPGQGPLASRFVRQHRVDFDVAITVANADSMRTARAFLGPSYEHGRRHIGYWVWETDRLPGNVAGAAAGLDCIWTPSEFSAAAIKHTLGPSVRVEVVPHAVVSRTPRGRWHNAVALPKGRTLIGFFFDARSVIERKNPAGLLRAFRRAFRADDRVTLVLKVNNAGSGAGALREIQALAEGLPVVWIYDQRLDELETAALINRLDIYASLHRAEGFGLVLAEAMSLGKAVIATGFSGNLDFMDNHCARLVRHREIVTDEAHGPYPRGTRWAEPDVEHAAELLRLLAGDRGLREEIGRKAKHRIEQTLAPWVVGRTIQRHLGWERDDAVVTSGVSSSAMESRAAGAGRSTVVTEAAGGQRVVPRA